MTAPLTYSMRDAAERLGGPFTYEFLKKHLPEIPHIRVGTGRGRNGRVAFSEQHLTEIVALFTVAAAPAASTAPQPVTRRRAS